MVSSASPKALLATSLIFGLLSSTTSAKQHGQSQPRCRYLPGDSKWPTTREWKRLNGTVEGRLKQTVSLASVCYEPDYDAAACEKLKPTWAFADTHFEDPASFTNPIFQNATDPFQSSPISLGNLPALTIDVRKWEDAAAGVNFADKHNIRLSIKNTGHDFLGKASGAGSLGLFTHNLKNMTVIEYQSSTYNGRAIKMGAGVQGYEVFEFAAANNLRVTGGTCASVGIAGGYMQGGGGGPLNNAYGLGADQALEWEVVTADGSHVIATPFKNSDLYWALSGGGAGTFAVVISVTMKAHPDGLVSGVGFTFTDAGVEQSAFWGSLTKLHEWLDAIHAAGGEAIVTIAGGNTFILNSITFPDKDLTYVKRIIAPWLAELDALNITYTPNFSSHPDWFSYYSSYFGPLPFGVFPSAQITVSRLVSPSVISQNNTALTATLREIGTSGPYFIALSSLGLPKRTPLDNPNAITAQWRTAASLLVVTLPWDFNKPREENMRLEKDLVERVLPLMEQVTPDARGYLNEGNWRQKDWKEAFYGENYGRLLKVKRKWDRGNLFYAHTAVGSDAWVVGGDGRMCRV